MNPKISVIIPIYNVETYLAKCLDSVVNQSYKDLEILCVNDCSPDNCDKILQEYAAKDKRIKIINRKENGGLSAARNSGLEAASGEFVYFIDSDDYIDLDYLEQMLSMIEKHGVDVVQNSNILLEFKNETKPFKNPKYPKTLPQGEFLDKITTVNNTICVVCANLYKREFLQKYKIRFPEGYIHEDEYFHHASKVRLDSIFVFYGAAYHYLQRQDSIMFSRKSKIESYTRIFTLVYKFYKENQLLNEKTRFKPFYLGSLTNIKDEREFFLVKKYANLIAEDFQRARMASSDVEKFIFQSIMVADSFDDYKTKAGKNIFLTYMTRGRMHRNKQGFKVSVIIPVYNTEKYLRKCLDSVCAQTLEDIEIICINDCSPDDSLQILQEYASNDNRIKIINFQENKGAAVARNAGIDAAKGEYIGFVDSDDFIDLDFYEKLYERAKQTGVEVVKGAIKELDENARLIDPNESAYDINDEIETYKAYFYHSFTSAIYGRFFLSENNIKFPNAISHFEDPYFAIAVAVFCKEIKVVNEVNYFYFRHNDSETKQEITEKTMNNIGKSIALILNLIATSNISAEHYAIVYNFLVVYATSLAKTVKHKPNLHKISIQIMQQIRQYYREYDSNNILSAKPQDILDYYAKFDNFKKENNSPKLKIFVSYIKPSFLFKNDIFVPIHLGRAVEKESSKDGVVTDDELRWLHENCIGDDDFEGNISKLNRRVAFFTGTYWAWKNYDKLGNPDYFGSYGYRKLLSPSFLNNLYDYDVILPKPTKFLISLSKQFIDEHGLDLYNVMIELIKTTYPKEIREFMEYLKFPYGYFYEMYVMKKDEFFKFCAWIFLIIKQFYDLYKDKELKNVGASLLKTAQTNNEKRDVAFILERITGYYLYKLTTNKRIRYCEVDVLAPEFKAAVKISNDYLLTRLKTRLKERQGNQNA